MHFKSPLPLQKISKEIDTKDAKIIDLQKAISNRKPLPPLVTSTLQQSSFQAYKFSSKKTMMLAQKLYEGVDIDGSRAGLITYMRTDSLNLSASSISSLRNFIQETYGAKYLPDNPNYYKTKSKLAQEAHEAIRPTDV